MTILNFFRSKPAREGAALASFLSGYSIEVMPRTAAKIDDFRDVLPAGTRVYIAHIEGTPIDDMVACAARVRDEGFTPMPHIPARWIDGRETLETWLRRYAEEAGVREALVLAGGARRAAGGFDSSMSLLETGLFDRHGFTRLHVAGHPEGNRDIDTGGGTALVDEAARWKQDFAERTGAEMALVTQFVFDAQPVIDWAERMRRDGIRLPIHVGVAGPAKLQTLLKFAVACGVGPSYSVLQKRAKDVTKLVRPFEPTEVLTDIAEYQAATPDTLIEGAHIFPLGGIRQAADYANRVSRSAPSVAARG
ncbi:methylenetetrahydrofolate reductase [Roseivivax halodurans JCM 10272]|uniref:Methylenetetrahydrofolate reductase n=1 Tax=Roseivivax halodurans JCM 10272 TaxID=1449350 RepID=X7EDW4_9RHOB|nr:methylenetetrahydrofolate reductase [Roseivivax halodurans]ETX14279.1 methylenetetrahydrofolate reductase [Roseivivax halodurans JCM 10272]